MGILKMIIEGLIREYRAELVFIRAYGWRGRVAKVTIRTLLSTIGARGDLFLESLYETPLLGKRSALWSRHI